MLANYLINKLLKLQFVSGFGGYDALSNPHLLLVLYNVQLAYIKMLFRVTS